MQQAFELIAARLSIRDSPAKSENPSRLLDDHLPGGEIPLVDAERVDGAVDRALGDELVALRLERDAGPEAWEGDFVGGARQS